MLKTGKLDSDLLEKIVFDTIKYQRPEVLVRSAIGEDCAVIDCGPYQCVLSTDPITASVKDIGRLAVHISCNDIASNGVEPVGIMIALLLPLGTTEEDIKHIMTQAAQAAADLKVEIIGGHTEITTAVNKPVIVSTAVGRGVSQDHGDQPQVSVGDQILVTKSAGLEGAGIIACDLEDRLSDILNPQELAKAQGFLSQVSVVKEGVAAGKAGVKHMHDVTEGGVLGALWEMCYTQKVGAKVYLDLVPVEVETVKICKALDIDYLRLISSGCMMMIVPEHIVENVMEAVRAEGVEINVIGQIVDQSQGITTVDQGVISEVEPPQSDEIYKVVAE